MKTLLQTAAALLFVAGSSLGLTSAAQAETPSAQRVYVDQVGDRVYTVRVSNPTLQRGRVQLVRLSDNKLLYQGISSRPSFGRKLNVQELPDGQYAFVVKLGAETHRIDLNLQTASTERVAELHPVTASR
ncbi:hypothetical protein F0P96_08445 [Hymenobacter busanensis]|uniref:Uncharacterized protein n=1 Tax=Hymenobacter busanensis TaxID=2607656 RepID=A0A7L5A1M2_9BACT|nr:hypothetical protein [Hymenobacter busanensis]KAA9333004.1 hypothetical protein F0P96_08445 [Hymenobacter busanensis]QHJ08322.1 hypothetical protein GUY19_13885 [Hymenobacter busanensis]